MIFGVGFFSNLGVVFVGGSFKIGCLVLFFMVVLLLLFLIKRGCSIILSCL